MPDWTVYRRPRPLHGNWISHVTPKLTAVMDADRFEDQWQARVRKGERATMHVVTLRGGPADGMTFELQAAPDTVRYEGDKTGLYYGLLRDRWSFDWIEN